MNTSPQEVPPPLPAHFGQTIPPNPMPPHMGFPPVNADDRKGRALALTSVIMAAAGILPLFFFVILCFERFGLGVLVFFLIGLVFHGLGALSGFFSNLAGHKKLGTIGIIGNVGIALGALFFFFIGIAFGY